MAGPASSRLAPQAAPPEPPEHVETDAATRIQEDLDKLLLACFNALLGVSKATAGGGGAGARPGGEAVCIYVIFMFMIGSGQGMGWDLPR